MNPQAPESEPYTPTLFDYVVDFFQGIPAAWILLGAVVLLGLAIWLTRRWLRYSRIIEGLKSAPLVTSDSTVTGLVKLVGQAYPGTDHSSSPYTNTSYVWCVSEKVDTRSKATYRKSGSYSVAPMLIRDSAGDCVVDPQEAVVVPTLRKSTVDNHFLDDSTYRTEKLIRPGDPVFALGQIRRQQTRENLAHCRLRKSDRGVLLFSGKSEGRTLLRFRLYFWPAFAAMILCVGLAGLGFWGHLQGYPNQSVGEYVDALMTRPFTEYPGANR